MTLAFLHAAIGDDLKRVDAVLRGSLDSDVALIRRIADYIVGGGGKRLRPALLLLVARACGDAGGHRYPLAAVVEMIHTATLLHDDVVDESSQRRGRATANATFGNAASVLVGDFLYSRAFQMMVGTGRMRVLEILSEATNVIAEGEVLQLMHAGDATLTSWLGLLAPVGTPPAIVDKLSKLSLEFVDSPEAKAHFAQRGTGPFAADAAAFRKAIVEDQAKWKHYIAAAGIQPE